MTAAGWITMIGALGEYACAALAAGTVYCWGSNTERQIAPRHPLAEEIPVPVSVGAPGKSVTGLCLRAFGAVAITDKGHAVLLPKGARVKWRRDRFRTLGCGEYHSCAASERHVVCWGRHGPRLGHSKARLYGGDQFAKAPPNRVGGWSGRPVKLAAGERFSCALTSKGRVACWGDHVCPKKTSPNNVRFIEPLSDITQLAANGSRVCAAAKTGGVVCWTIGSCKLSKPRKVAGLDEVVVGLAVGSEHSCALTRTHHVKCWGENGRGQLGIGTKSKSSVPRVVPL